MVFCQAKRNQPLPHSCIKVEDIEDEGDANEYFHARRCEPARDDRDRSRGGQGHSAGLET